MSDAKPKKAAAPKKPAEHPKYIEMIVAAIAALKERTGSSRQAIAKYVTANYKVGDNSATHLKQALRKGVASGVLSQPKGNGASGSFKLVKKAAEPKKKPAAKKPAAKKTAPKKKPATKKKTPKKAAKKPAKKPASAKKAKKPAAKKPAAKKPAAKKPAAKKVKKTPKKKSAAKK